MPDLISRRARAIVRRLRRLFPTAGMQLVYHNNWQLLVVAMLSAQCTDTKVNQVTSRLFKKYKKLEDYIQADLQEFEQDIRSTGLFRAKAKNILASARIIKERFKGQLPRTMPAMLILPGVARKTANVVLGNAYGVVEGIAVDTHVRRLARLWRLSKNTDPVKIERDLMAVIPRTDWFNFTYLVIEYGRHYCPARRRDHRRCPLAKFELA